MNKEQSKDQLRTAALYYHRNPKPGKIAVTPTKQLTNQYDLHGVLARSCGGLRGRSSPIPPKPAR